MNFIPLYLTNFFGVINDNFLKTLAGFVVLGWLGKENAGLYPVFMGATAAALVLPYILCSPIADRLTVVFEKRRILRFAKIAEIPIVAVGAAGFFLESIPLVVASILLMGLQSSLYSPAKYALVRDVGGEGRISTGMGGMEGVAFAAVLGGTVAASFAADRIGPWGWSAALFVFAALGLVFSLTIRARETKSREVHSINPARYLRRAYRMAKRYPGLNAVVFTLSAFWFAAAMMQQGVVVYGTQVLGLDSLHTGAILALAAVGIVAGQVIAGFVDRRHYLIGATLLTGWIAAALFAALFFVTENAVLFAALIAALAFDLGFFKLPLDAEIQKTVKGPKLNTMLAYFNQVSFIFMFASSVVYIAVSHVFGPRAFLAALALVMAVVPFLFVFSYQKVLLFTGRWIFRRRYAVTVEGMDAALGVRTLAGSSQIDESTNQQIDRSPHDESMNQQIDESTSRQIANRKIENRKIANSLLVLPNHPAMVDPMLVGAEFWRTPLKPLCDELFFRTGIVAPAVLKTLGAVAVPDLRKHRTSKGATIARGLSGIVMDTLAAGGDVIFYPSGHIYTEDREDIGTRQLAYNLAKELPENVRVIGVRTTGLWGSIWSRKGRKDSPPFVPTFVKSVLLWFFVSPFVPRRKVTMHIEDLTERVKSWAATLTRLEFNAKLNDWYNGK